MTASSLRLAAVRRVLYPDADLRRIAYNAAEAATALGVDIRKVWALLRTGQIPARNTGKQYLLPGATLIDINEGRPLPGINDHRDPETFQVDRLYTRANLAVLLGTTRPVVRGLVEGGRVEETESIGSARYITGATVLAYLNGADEPLRETG